MVVYLLFSDIMALYNQYSGFINTEKSGKRLGCANEVCLI